MATEVPLGTALTNSLPACAYFLLKGCLLGQQHGSQEHAQHAPEVDNIVADLAETRVYMHTYTLARCMLGFLLSL